MTDPTDSTSGSPDHLAFAEKLASSPEQRAFRARLNDTKPNDEVYGLEHWLGGNGPRLVVSVSLWIGLVAVTLAMISGDVPTSAMQITLNIIAYISLVVAFLVTFSKAMGGGDISLAFVTLVIGGSLIAINVLAPALVAGISGAVVVGGVGLLIAGAVLAVFSLL